MPDLSISRLRSVSLRHSLLAFGIGLTVLLSLTFIEVTIIVESPAIGDVSDVVGIAVGATATILSIISGGITVYNFVSESEERRDEGPTDHIVIEGDFVEGDLHYHLGDPTFRQPRSAERTDDEGNEGRPENESGDEESATNG